MTTPPKPRGFSSAGWNLLVLALKKLCQDRQQQAYDKQRVVNHDGLRFWGFIGGVELFVVPLLGSWPTPDLNVRC